MEVLTVVEVRVAVLVVVDVLGLGGAESSLCCSGASVHAANASTAATATNLTVEGCLESRSMSTERGRTASQASVAVASMMPRKSGGIGASWRAREVLTFWARLRSFMIARATVLP